VAVKKFLVQLLYFGHCISICVCGERALTGVIECPK
jgi:hypothetical protein